MQAGRLSCVDSLPDSLPLPLPACNGGMRGGRKAINAYSWLRAKRRSGLREKTDVGRQAGTGVVLRRVLHPKP
jgi:hypothetical protein